MTEAELSKLLFDAREAVAMWADVVAARAGQRDAHTDGIVEQLDAYRVARGWDPDGYGREAGPSPVRVFATVTGNLEMHCTACPWDWSTFRRQPADYDPEVQDSWMWSWEELEAIRTGHRCEDAPVERSSE